MRTLTDFVVGIFDVVAGRPARACARDAERELKRLGSLEDDEILLACREMVRSPKAPGAGRGALADWYGAKLGQHDVEALALAAEAFARFPPAGLSQGARLYDEQLLAAAHLLAGALVQMDTGEGKTFALLTAALALLRIHPRVYILTANPYLCARDAAAAAQFWNEIGVSIGRVSTRDDDPVAWQAQVVYTTFDRLVSRNLNEDHWGVEEIEWSAVLIDEADAILLEEGTKSFDLISASDDPVKGWAQSLAIAEQLDEECVQIEIALEPGARLTSKGEAQVLSMLGREGLAEAEILRVLLDVEIAYTALRVVRPGVHYEVREGHLVSIDPASGWHTPHATHPWLGPLAEMLGVRSPPRHAVIHFLSSTGLLRRFAHVAGASGTVINEALDYLILLRLVPAVIPPRVPRQDLILPDHTVASRAEALEWIEEQVAASGPTRPILIATSSLSEAAELASRLSDSEEIRGVQVRLATDETIAAGRIFENAGRPGVTIVSTRVAGRGVDIRLSDAAKDNGGAMLIAIGHALHARLDRQLLGRVGREGDPYSAQFVNHPDDEVLSFSRQAMHKILTTFAPEEGIESRQIGRMIASSQRAMRRIQMQRFATSIAEANSWGESSELLRTWRLALGPEEECGEEFFAFLAERHLACSYPALSFGETATIETVATVAEGITALTGDGAEVAEELAVTALGARVDEASEVFTSYLVSALLRARKENEAARAELSGRLREALAAAAEVRALSLLESLAELPEGASASEEVEVALGAAPDASRVLTPFWEAERIAAYLRRGAASRPGREFALGIRDLILAEGELAGAESSVVAARSGALGAAIDRRAPRYSEYEDDWRSLIERSSWEIASKSIDAATQQLNSAIIRARFQVAQTVAGTRFASSMISRTRDLNREAEAALARELCVNLLAAGELRAHDQLFSLAEHAVPISTPETKFDLPELPPPDPEALTQTAPVPVPARWDALISDYVAAVEQRDTKLDREFAILALKALLGNLSLASLSDPDRVSEAYENWLTSETRFRVAPWRWRAADALVRGFLEFLYENGLAAPRPKGPSGRTRSMLRRLRRRATAPGIALAFASLALSAFLALVFGLAPAVGGAPNLGTLGGLIDRLLSAGSFAAGSALGPILVGLCGGMWARILLGAPIQNSAGISSDERWLSALLLAASALALSAPWSEGLSPYVVAALIFWVAIVFAGLIVRNGVYRFEQMTQYRTLAALTAGFALTSALPYLAERGGAGRVWAIALVTATVGLVCRPLRRARIPVRALHNDGGSQGPAESITLALTINGRLWVVHHAFAAITAWAFSCVLVEGASEQTRIVLAGVSYLAVLAFWARVRARGVTSLELWQGELRKRDRAFEPDRPGLTLGEALTSARTRIFGVEVTVTALQVTVASALTLDAPGSLLSVIPVGVAALFLATIVVEFSFVFLRSLRGTVLGPVDSAPKRSSEESSLFATDMTVAVRRYGRRLGVLLVVLVVLRTVNDLLGVWELVAGLVEWLVGLI